MKQNKNLGIGIGTLLVIGIIVVTVGHNASKKVADNTSAATSQNTLSDSGMPLSGIATNNTSSSGNSPSSASSTVFSRFFGGDDGGEEGEGGEDGGGSGSTATTSSSVTTSSTTPTSSSGSNTSAYKNGTYSVSMSYMSPGGMDGLGVSITLSNGVITDSSVTPQPSNRTSSRYESSFASSYKGYVVGKPIASLSVGTIAGASLTTASFNQALASIRTKAKA